MTASRHDIWFERTVSDELRPLIPSSVAARGPATATDPLAGLDGGRVAIAASMTYDAAVFDAAPHLLAVVRTGIGYDTIDVGTATEREIAVCNVPDGPTVSTAEHAVALILHVAKRITESAQRLKDAEGDYYLRHQAIELSTKTLGLVGFGRIARRVAAVAAALEMQVIAHDPWLDDEAFTPLAKRSGSFEELLAQSDVVSVHVPATSDTTAMFGAAAFSVMRPGAVFVNTARGALVDHDALLVALDSGRLAAAALDVTDPEPLPPQHPLLTHPNVIVTPHVASGTKEARERMFEMAVRQAVMVLDGQRPPHLVNPDVWPQVLARLGDSNGQ